MLAARRFRPADGHTGAPAERHAAARESQIAGVMSAWAKVLGVALALLVVLDGLVARFGGLRKLLDLSAKTWASTIAYFRRA